ncbi:MAG: hypothetical protein BEN19_06980 [Epulopiscium sp. Nuni2H_MBin003]|nr:MAG: hypothetical protein BEN19_06980 [Epulopiscium sp. Nuni2H_MBin003]
MDKKVKVGLTVGGVTTIGAILVGTMIFSNHIGKEQARQIAFNHAGINDTEVVFANTGIDFDDMRFHYDVEFIVEGTEYDYEIDATTGIILDADSEGNYRR